MMDKYKYRVLWFDDEFESFENDVDTAAQLDIELIGFKNAETGLVELNQNYKWYDAIIVDGLFYKNATQKGDTDKNAFGEVAKTISNLKSQGIIIPWFVYSGQKSFVKEKNDYIELFSDKSFGNGKVFDKNTDGNFEAMCAEIKKAADEIGNTKLKQKYAKVFEVCTDKYIGVKAADDLLKILSQLDNCDEEIYFTSIRKIIEDIFIAFNKNSLLPIEFVSPQVSLNESSKFLSGKTEKGFRLEEQSKLPRVISSYLRNILEVCQPAAHRSHIDDHLGIVKTNYLLKSNLFQLLDTIIWFKIYIDSNPIPNNWVRNEDAAANNSEDCFIGYIQQDANNNYYCDTYALSYTFTKNNFTVGDKIKITQWNENTDSRTSLYYTHFAMRFEKINE